MTFRVGRLKVVGVGGTLRELDQPTYEPGGIPKARQRTDGPGNVTGELYGRRLDASGGLVLDLAQGLAARDAKAELAGVAG